MKNVCLSGGVQREQGKKGVHTVGWYQSPMGCRSYGLPEWCPAQYPFNRTGYEEQSCWTAPGSLTWESTATFTPGHASFPLGFLPANDWTWWERSNKELWAGASLHIRACVDICFSGDLNWLGRRPCKTLGTKLKSSGRCYKIINFIKQRSFHSRMSKEYLLLHKEIQWLSRGKVPSRALSWKGSFKSRLHLCWILWGWRMAAETSPCGTYSSVPVRYGENVFDFKGQDTWN